MSSKSKWIAEAWIERFGVCATDPGFVYIFESDGKYKIGRTLSPEARTRAAKTWLPQLTIVGIKPFWQYRVIERLMHIGFAMDWYEGEWFMPFDDSNKEILVDGFRAFSDQDINRNSVNFVYWFNGDGMAEFVQAHFEERLSTKRFLEQEAAMSGRRTKSDSY